MAYDNNTVWGKALLQRLNNKIRLISKHCLHPVCPLRYYLNSTDSTKSVYLNSFSLSFFNNIYNSIVPLIAQTFVGTLPTLPQAHWLPPHYFLDINRAGTIPPKGFAPAVPSGRHFHELCTRELSLPSSLSSVTTFSMNIPGSLPNPTLPNAQILLYLSFFYVNYYHLLRYYLFSYLLCLVFIACLPFLECKLHESRNPFQFTVVFSKGP